MTKDVRINLRLTPDKRAAYHAAAKTRGLKMTEWILSLADSALGLVPAVKTKLPDTAIAPIKKVSQTSAAPPNVPAGSFMKSGRAVVSRLKNK